MDDSQGKRCDVLITGATVYDGSGQPPVAADVAVTGDRISGIGSLAGKLVNRMSAAERVEIAM